MPTLLVNDRVLVTFVGQLHAQRTMNTFLYRVAAATQGNDLAESMTHFHTALGLAGELRPGFLGCVPANFTLSQCWYQVIAPARFRKIVYPMATLGLWGHATSVSNVAGSITRVGVMAKRTQVGGVRIPISAGPETCDSGFLHTNLKAKFQSLCNAMKHTIITQQVVNTFIPQVGTPKAAMGSEDLFDAFFQDTARTVRRRTVGLGI